MSPEELQQAIAYAAARAGRPLPGHASARVPLRVARTLAGEGRADAPIDADWGTPVARLLSADATEAEELAERIGQQLLDTCTQVEAVAVRAGSGQLLLQLTDADRAESVRDVIRDVEVPEPHVEPGPDDESASPARALVLDDDELAVLQHAHAHLTRLIRTADAAGVEADPGADLRLLASPAERLLTVLLGDPRRGGEGPARGQGAYLSELVAALAAWREPVRPDGTRDEQPTATHGARLLLAIATRIVLSGGLIRAGATPAERI